MEFEEAKREYLEGRTFTYRGKVATGFATLDDLLMKMHLADVASPESKLRYERGADIIMRKLAYVGELMDTDHGDAEEESIKLFSPPLVDWFLEAFRKDSEFVDSAVNLIINGKTRRYFE